MNHTAAAVDTTQSTTAPAIEPPPAWLPPRPTPRYPVAYKVPTVAEVTTVLDHVYARVDSAVSPQFVDRAHHQITDVSHPVTGLRVDIGADGFNPISYPIGVIHVGMMDAAEATGDKRFSDYTAKWLTFYADNLQALGSWPPPAPRRRGGGRGGRGGARPTTAPAATQEAASTDVPATQPTESGDGTSAGRNGFGNGAFGGVPGVNLGNPFHNLLTPDSLDACGAMTTGMIKARLAGVGPDMKPVIDRAVKFVSTGQFRLPDGTLARHRPVAESVWADDMYMGVSILTAAGKLTGDTKYYDDAAKQVLQISQRLYVPSTGLLTHGWNTKTAEMHPKYYWGRANGWCMMAMAELLTVLPEDHPQREAVLKQFRTLATSIATYQAGDGLWHQMLDRPDSFTETSCSAMFTFAYARGVDKGFLDPATFGPVALSGWCGLLTRVDRDGHITGTCVGTTYANDYVYYLNRPSTDDVHGYGPTLLAGAEIIKLLKNPKYFITTGMSKSDPFTVMPASQRFRRPGNQDAPPAGNDSANPEGNDAATSQPAQ